MNFSYKMIVFDWDGTLMDSAPRIVSAMRKAAKDIGLEVPTESAVRHIIGLSMEACFERLFPTANGSDYSALFEAYRYEYVDGDHIDTPLFDGMKDMLLELNQKGFILAVATGKGRNGLTRVMNEVNVHSLFHDSICADEAKSKPHPDMLETLMSRQSLDAKDCVMIGDTSHDLAMAANAKMDSIAVSYGAHDVDDFHEHSPTKIMHQPSELRVWLKQHLKPIKK